MAQWKWTSLDQIVSSISSYSSYLIIHMIGKFHANPGKPYNLLSKVRKCSRHGLEEKQELQCWVFESSLPAGPANLVPVRQRGAWGPDIAPEESRHDGTLEQQAVLVGEWRLSPVLGTELIFLKYYNSISCSY